MLVDILLPGWVPYNSFNLNEDVPGSIAAPAKAMAYSWTHFIGGHMGRLGTRDDTAVYQRYVTDLIDNIKQALVAVDPTPFFTRYGNNSWAAVQTYQAAQVDFAAAPVIKKYTGVLAAADVYTASTTFPSSSRSASTSASTRRSTRDGSRSGPGHGSRSAGPPGRRRVLERTATRRVLRDRAVACAGPGMPPVAPSAVGDQVVS
jgi:hypothetical protein